MVFPFPGIFASLTSCSIKKSTKRDELKLLQKELEETTARIKVCFDAFVYFVRQQKSLSG